MTYQEEYSQEARSYLRRLPPDIRARVVARVDELCLDPFAPGISKPLHGPAASTRSSRVGGLRIIYTVQQARLLVTVTRIGPRGDVYRG